MRYCVVLLLLMMSYLSMAQPKAVKAFQKTLAEFRYTLNKDLAQMEPSRLRNTNYLGDEAMAVKVGTFAAKHEADIIRLRKWHLDQMLPLSESTIDGYAVVEEIDFLEMKREYDGISEGLMKYVRMGLKEYVFTQLHMLLGQLGIDAIVQFSTMNAVATPRYFAKKLPSGAWHVRFDNYLYLADFEVDAETGEAVFAALWKRDEVGGH